MPFFPWRYEDEHLLSLVARYRRYTQQSSSAVREQLFGNRRYRTSLDAPTSIAAFCSAIGTGDLSDVRFVIENLTPYPYMSAYASREESAVLFNGMASESRRDSRHPPRGVLVPRIEGLRYCSSCFRENMEKHAGGEAYWRRSHQLPSVIVCTKHRVLLQSTGTSGLYDPTNFATPAIGLIGAGAPGATVSTDDEPAMSMLHELAVRSERLLEGLEEAQEGAVAIEGYRTAIRRIGLTWGRRLDYPALSISFADVLEPILPAFPSLLASDGYPSWWIREFLRGAGYVRNDPLLHLLVGLWLDHAGPLRDNDARVKQLRIDREKSRGRGSAERRGTRSRDALLADRVADAAHRIKSIVPLTRVTRSKLAGELGVSTLSRSTHAQEFWPLTSHAITTVAETADAFTRRRIEREIEKVALEGFEPRVHLILKRLGRRDGHGEVADAIAAWKAQSSSDK